MGSKKSSPTKTALEIGDEASSTSTASALAVSNTPNAQPSQTDTPALIRCKHLSSMSDFLKMYHIVARRIHWGREVMCCAECKDYQPPLQVCLQCPRVACGHPENHQQTHSTDSGHALSIEVQSGAMFCSVCKVWVWNDLMASVWQESRQSNSEASPTIAQFDKVQFWIAESGEMTKRHCGNIRGLYNLGNTCFMNCILQTILHIEPLRKFFLASDGPFHWVKTCPRTRSNEACIACEIDAIFCQMYDGSDHPIAPNKMLESLWRISKDLAGYEQQDAHELFVTMRNSLHTHLEGAMYNCSCVVHRIFSGVLQSDLTCLQCGNVTETLDPFLDVSLDIPPSMDGLDLEECLRRFTRAEHLPAGNYICSACHRNHPEIAKQLTIRSSPQILSIHLKRFEHGLASTKIDTAVHFEEYLSLSPFMVTGFTDDSEQCGYHLFAVISHVGNLDSGHYTCFIKSRDQWFWIDDACVSACSWQEVVRCNAYMLFYICDRPSELRALRVLGSYMKRRALLDTDYSEWTREQLIQRIYSLEGKSVKKSKPQRPLDFSQYPTKRVALKIAYFGWEYNGFASQMSYKPDGAESTRNPTVVTVEDLLFSALMKTRLIESPRTCQYSRCGRTDAGVSATGQVVALTIRSSGQKHETDKLEIPVCTMLNRLLPDDIRVLGWSPIPSVFDARFSCRGRRYKYFFHGLGLDLAKMEEAAAKLVGEHDFRNFCRIDKAVSSFVRRIFSSTIRKLEGGMYEYEIHGSAFLYHQVRCTMEILFLVGRRVESPEVVDYLLDISQCTDPPQYDIASEIPLVLSECYYNEDLSFRMDEAEGKRLASEIFTFWRDAQAKAMTVAMLRNENDQTDPFHGKSTKSRILHK